MHLKVRSFAVSALTIVSMSPACADVTAFSNGDRVRMTAGVYGCREIDDEEAIVKLMAAGDHAAAATLVRDKRGGCKLLSAGTVGTVEDRSALHNKVMIRPAGSPYGFWTLPEVLAR